MKDKKNQDQVEKNTPENKLTSAEEIKKLEQEIKTLNEQRLLALANLDNTRKMFERDLIESRKYFFQNVAKDLIQILDNFEMAFSVKNTSDEVKQFLKGFEMTYKMLKDILISQGINEIPIVIGDSFDSRYHQATMQKETNDYAENTIMQVLRKGYKIYDRILRPIEVITAKPCQENLKNNKLDEKGEK